MLNALDKLIGYVSPSAGLSRARARAAMSAVKSYEAASRGRRTEGWRATNGDSNAEIGGALDMVRKRHRDLVRNNPWASRAVQAIVNNTVGSGIIGLPKSPSGQRARKLKQSWDRWANSTDCDADGRHDLYGLQALILRMCVESGEALIRKRVVASRGRERVRLALQLIEGDMLDLAKTQNLTDGAITFGVERDSAGAVRGYWLFPEHPGNAQTVRTLRSEFVAADEVIHLFRVERPGQVRGMPWGASAMLSLRDLDGYEDAILLRQKLSACFTAFIGDIEADAPGGTPASSTDTRIESIEPGMVEYLPPGKTVTFASPPSGGEYGPFTRDVLKRVAAAYGITYEVLTGDLSNVNFSSGRMGWLEFSRNIDAWRWQMLIPQCLDRIGQWFLVHARLSLGDGIEQGAQFSWTPPRRQMIDPTKEVPAMIDAIRGGLQSLQSTHRELGLDTEEVLAEMKADSEALDAAGLSIDSDGRKPRNATPAPAAPVPDPEGDPTARAVAAMGERMSRATERMGDLFAGMQPPSVTLTPQFHVSVDANRKGATIREVLETDADGVPTKVIERQIPDNSEP